MRSSLTGTFGGAICNTGRTRSYPYSYTISVANTWEKKTIYIAGDTTGTWNTNGSAGIGVSFTLGAGSNYYGTAGAWAAGNYPTTSGATNLLGTLNAVFGVTSVQFELAPATASSGNPQSTAFQNRPYQQELNLCQRYFIHQRFSYFGYNNGSTTVGGVAALPVGMRSANPTFTLLSNYGSYGFSGSNVTLDAVYQTYLTAEGNSFLINLQNSSGTASGAYYAGQNAGDSSLDADY